MENSKLYKSKRVNLKKYSAMELSYLLLDLLKEIDKRDSVMENVLNKMNSDTFIYTHEIELEEYETATEKTAAFDKLKKHLESRRLAKKDYIVLRDCLDVINQKKVMTELVPKIKSRQKYFRYDDGAEIVSSRDFLKFHKNYIENPINIRNDY